MTLSPAAFAKHLPLPDTIRLCLGSVFAAATALTMMNAPGFAASVPPNDPSGYWSTKDDESIIRIAPCSTMPSAKAVAGTPPATTQPFCGILVWLKEPLEKGAPKTDTLNPDKEKKGQPLIGMELFTELVAEEEHWKGKAYNSDDGKTYDITFKVMPDKVKGDKGEITGCVLRILCQSETFTKVQTVPGGDPTLPPATAQHGTAPAAKSATTPASTPQPHSH